LVLRLVTVVMATALLIMVAVAVTGATNPASERLFDVCSDAFKIAFGAIVGLLGIKSV